MLEEKQISEGSQSWRFFFLRCFLQISLAIEAQEAQVSNFSETTLHGQNSFLRRSKAWDGTLNVMRWCIVPNAA